MPLLTVYTTEPRPADPSALLKSLSSLIAKELKKPEAYVMTSLMPETAMTFAGTSEPSCYVELKSIGEFSHDTTERLSSLLCAALSKSLGVSQKRIYIEFANPPAHLWGHDGATFG
jgi:phenylpyruvate tautomerase PptA (4-oxalocrotonate tautomerase family)